MFYKITGSFINALPSLGSERLHNLIYKITYLVSGKPRIQTLGLLALELALELLL